MYNIDEFSDNPYAVDAPHEPMEITRENVLAAQGLTGDSFSLEELEMAMESAVNDVTLLGDQIIALEETRNNKQASDEELRKTLTTARSVRRMLMKKYGVDQYVRAAETYHDRRSLILAIEEESNENTGSGDEKGFFAKIIDGIINAFKWLWEKITGIFSKKKDKETVEKEIAKEEKATEELKAKVDSGEVKPPEKPELDKADSLLHRFGWIGKEVKPDDVLTHLTTLAENINAIAAIAREAIKEGSMFSDSIKEITPDNVNDKGSSKTVSATIAEMVKSVETEVLKLPKGSSSSIPGYLKESVEAKKNEDALTKVGDSLVYLPGFINGSALVGIERVLKQPPFAKYHALYFLTPTKSEELVATKIDFIPIALMEKIQRQIGTLRRGFYELTAELETLTKSASATTDKIKSESEAFMKKLSDQDDKGKRKEAIAAITSLLKNAGLTMSTSITAAVSAISAAERTNAVAQSYLKASRDAYESKKKKEEGGKKGEKQEPAANG